MTYSMTGFGASASQYKEWSIEVQIKSLNHKNIDIHVNMPGKLSMHELLFHKLVKQHVGRGRIDIEISLRATGQLNAGLNYSLLEQRVATLEKLFGGDWSQRKCMEFCLQQRDLWEKGEIEQIPSLFLEQILETTRVALEALASVRRREGKALREYFLNTIDELETSRQHMSLRAPERIGEYKQRLEERMATLCGQTGLELDERLLAYEVAAMSDKFDITEELTRIGAHLSALRILMLSSGDPLTCIGKKIDFYLQELNREVTTIASKSRDTILTRHSIDIRTTLESMREQASNVQ